MAPNTGKAAAARAPRKSLGRIVPAIPLALTRSPASARPITPEDTSTEVVTQQDAEPPPSTVEKAPDHGLEGPLTPDSKSSGLHQGDVEAKTPASLVGVSKAPLLAQEPEPVSAQSDNADDKSASAANYIVNGSGGEVQSTSVAELPAGGSDSTPTVPPSETTNASVSQALSPSTHKSRASLDGIVFGTTQESPALQSTPPEVEPDTTTLPQSVPRHPPGFAPPQFAAPFYPGHSHHPPNPQAAHFAPAAANLPLPSQNGGPHPASEFHPLAFAGQVPYQGSFQRQSSPLHTPVLGNGTAVSHSGSPIKSQYLEHEEEHYKIPYQNGAHPVTNNSTPPSFEPTKFREPFELADYLSSNFGNLEFADYVLRVHVEDAILLNIPVHGIIVARSRTISSAIRNVPPAQQPRGTLGAIDIFTRDRYITPEALNEAVKVLYGAPLMSVEYFIHGLGPFHPDGEQGPTFAEARIRMSQAISYAAVGKLFRLHSMHERGVEIIKALLRWDTFDQALSFGLDSQPYSHGGVSNQKETGSSPSPDSYFATKILEHDVTDFIAYNFPTNFRLYTIAPELKYAPRLPPSVERTSHNPRLSRIRFGDVPSEEDFNPDYVARALSGALLSIPLPLLDHLLNHRAVIRSLGWERLHTIIQDIIDERERRRQKGAKSGVVNTSGSTSVTAENLLWVEHNVPSTEHASGRTLTETRDPDYF